MRCYLRHTKLLLVNKNKKGCTVPIVQFIFLCTHNLVPLIHIQTKFNLIWPRTPHPQIYRSPPHGHSQNYRICSDWEKGKIMATLHIFLFLIPADHFFLKITLIHIICRILKSQNVKMT